MKLKTLLLSSAAAFAVVGGAQAADLSVAEPVDHVKVCDAFGAGYWYIPGSDTCLKIGGLVQFDVNFHTTALTAYTSSGTHSSGWDMTTEAHLDVTVKSMTEYGPLTGFIEARWLSNNADVKNNLTGFSAAYNQGDSGMLGAYLDTAYLSLGMLTVGRLESAYHYFGGYLYNNGDYDAGDQNVDQVKLTWAMSGFGLALAIEDPRDRWGTNLSSTYSMPDIVGAITFAQGNWDAQVSGGFGETTAGSGFGAQIGMTFKLDSIAAGDKLALQAAWAQSEVPLFGAGGVSTPYAGGSVWSALVGFQHYWSPTVSSSFDYEYQGVSGTGATATNAWEAGANLVWSPVSGFTAGVEGDYVKAEGSTGVWKAKIRLVRSW